MYKITMIPKQSTLEDIKKSWIDSGREWNGDLGEFCFDDVDCYEVISGAVMIQKEDCRYVYNTQDFYRLKIQVMPE